MLARFMVAMVLVAVVAAGVPLDAAASPTGQGCAFYPVLGFARMWYADKWMSASFGCAIEAEKPVHMAEQRFTNGTMIWRSDTDRVYVIYAWGGWESYVPTWQPGAPESDDRIVAPPGYFQPKRGFGSVWRDAKDVRDRIGWAVEEERAVGGTAQAFERGFMMWTPQAGVRAFYPYDWWRTF